MEEQLREALMELPREMGTSAVSETSRSALELSLKMGEYLVSLKIENSWLIGACAVGGIGLAAFYIHRKFPASPAERRLATELAEQNASLRCIVGATRNGLERNEDGEINPEVMMMETGSILVTLVCHTKESFLTFVDDFKAQKIKQSLEKEFRKIGCNEELEVTVTSALDALGKSSQEFEPKKEQEEATQEGGTRNEGRTAFGGLLGPATYAGIGGAIGGFSAGLVGTVLGAPMMVPLSGVYAGVAVGLWIFRRGHRTNTPREDPDGH